jgi:hypothetical protein
MQPSTAEYWHIGAMTIRLANSRLPTRNGVNSALMPTSPQSSWRRQVGVSLSAYFRKTRSTVVFPQPAGRVGELHDRVPVILAKNDSQKWLGEEP